MLECQRSQFFLETDEHYLNCAYLSPTTRSIERAAGEALQLMRRPSLVTSEMFFSTADKVREAYAALVGADRPESIAIIPSVSYGIATVARNAPVARGQRIVLVQEQFPSNVYSWRRLAAETGAQVTTVSPESDSPARAVVWTERILECIDAKTAVVAVPNVHWADGIRFDLRRIGERARDVGALLVVDGSQSVGAVPTNISELKPDALICAGYKWLFGPYSLCLAYYGPALRGGVPLEENWIARKGSRNFRELVAYRDDYEPGSIRFDVGERSNFLLLPMMLAGLHHVADWRPERIQAYCASILEPGLEMLREEGFRMEPAEGRFSHMVGVRLPERVSPDRVSAALEAAGVHISMRGSALRISPHVYNDARDVSRLVDVLTAESRS